MEKICEIIQQSVLFKLPLNEIEMNHLQSCKTCRQMVTEDEKLRSIVTNLMEADIPKDFADQIMTKILCDETEFKKEKPLLFRFLDSLDAFLSYPALQYLAFTFGGIISSANFLQLIFGVFIPN